MKKLSYCPASTKKTIRDIVAKVLAADRHGLDIELIIVDDGSGTSQEIIAELRKSDDRIKSIFQEQIGKGAALRAGIT